MQVLLRMLMVFCVFDCSVVQSVPVTMHGGTRTGTIYVLHVDLLGLCE